MRIRTLLGLLLGVGFIFLGSYLSHLNQHQLSEPFYFGKEATLPLWAVLLVVFLLGFLPVVTVLVIDTVRRDLAQREERRKAREAESLGASFRRAADLAADGQWAKAAGELEVVLAAQPNDFSGLLRYGEVLRRAGRLDEALEVHRRACVQYPTSVALLYELVEDYDARGEPEVAREVRNRILREMPHLGLKVLIRRRNAALGARRFETASELEAKIESLVGAEGSGEDPTWRERVKLGLEYQRGVACLEADAVDEASTIFAAVLERQPSFVPAWILWGEAELVAEREEAAVSRWLAGFEQTGRPVFLQRIEDHFIERQDPKRAIETLRRLIADRTHDLLPRFFLGRLYYRLEMLDEATKVLEGLAERLDASPTYHYLMGRLRERRGELRPAVVSYRTAARELGLPHAEYACRVCGASHPDWQDRCEACGSWSAVEMSFAEEQVSEEELGLGPAVILEGPIDWDPTETPQPAEVGAVGAPAGAPRHG